MKQKQQTRKESAALIESPSTKSGNLSDINNLSIISSPSGGGFGGGGGSGGVGGGLGSGSGSNCTPHVCPRCDKVYTYKKNLSRHLRFECGILPQEKCPYCGYLTRYKHSLNVHVRTQHPDFYNVRNKT